jgi:hypothetical protein
MTTIQALTNKLWEQKKSCLFFQHFPTKAELRVAPYHFSKKVNISPYAERNINNPSCYLSKIISKQVENSLAKY